MDEGERNVVYKVKNIGKNDERYDAVVCIQKLGDKITAIQITFEQAFFFRTEQFISAYHQIEIIIKLCVRK